MATNPHGNQVRNESTMNKQDWNTHVILYASHYMYLHIRNESFRATESILQEMTKYCNITNVLPVFEMIYRLLFAYD